MYPKVSIITVCLNAADDLEQTISSVELQDYKEVEYVIIDGGSTDESIKKIKESRVDYWVSEPDNGLFHAMNKGIQACTGSWVLFLNAGDILVNKSVLSNIFKVTDDYSEYGVLYGHNLFRGVKNNCYQPNVLELGTIMACHQSMFFNKDLLKEQLHYKIDKFKYVLEYELLSRIYCENIKIHYTPEVVSDFKEGGISSRLFWKVRIPRFYWMIKYFGVGSIFKYITNHYIRDIRTQYLIN